MRSFGTTSAFLAMHAMLAIDAVIASCDLTGPAWPDPSWRDIMRGTSIRVCDTSRQGDGYCDYVNNMASDSCAMDGGDCCLTSCIAHCVSQQVSGRTFTGDVPYMNPSEAATGCANMCGLRAAPVASGNCPYLCLADDYMGAGSEYTSWCSSGRGTQKGMSECYSTRAEIVTMLQECILDDRSHGNSLNGNMRCGNQTGDCTLGDVIGATDGCDLHPSECMQSACCTLAASKGWIDRNRLNTSDCELLQICASDPTCFSSLAQCARTNKACQGGCCMCNRLQWFGSNCDRPLCNPRCKNGGCVAPNTCACAENFSGPSCEVPLCTPNCVGGQGVCVAPNRCECFYGWSGAQCETPISNPPCVNGIAIAPDVCRCDSGWGGRICDYPLCQSYPNPSADCDHGVCESPWSCKCEPGWTKTVPVDRSGLAITPLYWKGRDLSAYINASDFVFGDTRFNQTGEETFFFLEYNAYKCSTAKDCGLIAGPRCRACVGSTCTQCESGFFLEQESLRCKRCNEIFDKCRQCDSQQCLVCDPLFVLINKECVSVGIFEFSSDIYNVKEKEEFVEIFVLRAPHSMAGALADDPITVTVQTTATTGSTPASSFSSFSVSRIPVTFQNSSVFSQSVRIFVFDNAQVDSSLNSFNVSLIYDPRATAGATFPISPSGRVSPYNDAPLASSSVYIWDVSGIDPSRCDISPAFLNSSSAPLPVNSFPVFVRCLVCEFDPAGACSSWTSFAEPVTIITSTAFGSNFMASNSTNASFSDGYVSLSPVAPPTINTPFTLSIQVGFPGVVAQQFLVNANPAPGQAADVTRIEPRILTNWTFTQDAPLRSVFSGYLHFECLKGIIPSSIGFGISQGATISVIFDSINAINSQRALNTSESDLAWQAPSDMTTVQCDSNVFCFNQSFAPDWVIPFTATFLPSLLFQQRPAGINMLFLTNQTWEIVPTACLYAGIDVPYSPVRGLST